MHVYVSYVGRVEYIRWWIYPACLARYLDIRVLLAEQVETGLSRFPLFRFPKHNYTHTHTHTHTIPTVQCSAVQYSTLL